MNINEFYKLPAREASSDVLTAPRNRVVQVGYCLCAGCRLVYPVKELRAVPGWPGLRCWTCVAELRGEL